MDCKDKERTVIITETGETVTIKVRKCAKWQCNDPALPYIGDTCGNKFCSWDCKWQYNGD